jgi:glycine C-acetyltransferase
VRAAQEGLSQFGYGMSSVRFICGTQTIHKTLEKSISEFLGFEDAVLYSSCFDANGGLFETLLGPEDAVISDELNHASIIDGIRLCKARRFKYRNNDMQDLEDKLRESGTSGFRMIATDGVFSMDGILANLPEICALAEKYQAMVMVDDSHATGFVGSKGRGTFEHWGMTGKIDILTSTLGKALGGASGGFTASSRRVAELLRQKSRPYLFSNSLAPVIAYTTLKALEIIEGGNELRIRLNQNTRLFRTLMEEAGFDIVPGSHPIVPIMIYDALKAKRLASDLLKVGIFVVSFSYPVVPKDKARIRVQLSAGHSPEEVREAVDKFTKVGRALELV